MAIWKSMTSLETNRTDVGIIAEIPGTALFRIIVIADFPVLK